MRVTIVGGGHIGLPTALSLARVGHQTVVYDTDMDRIEGLAAGSVHFYEPELEPLLLEQVSVGSLRFTSDPDDACLHAEVAFICVETPIHVDGKADLGAVASAAEAIAASVRDPIVVVLKSTVPVGTGAWVQALFAELGRSALLTVASNPEFLREGSAVSDALRPARILVGSASSEALSILRDVYAPFVRDGAILIETDVQTAELTKYASNAFLAMKISYANLLAEICDAVGADVVSLTDVLGLDPRIGGGHLGAGMGYGGGCLSKDLTALRATLADRGLQAALLDEVDLVNERALLRILEKVRAVLGDPMGRRVTLLGLAFKPGTDDVRMAPALRLAVELLEAGADVVGYDPRATGSAKRSLPDLHVEDDIYEALQGADCAVVCTEWDQIRGMDLDLVKSAMARPLIVDGRNVFDPAQMSAAGFTYVATGRGGRVGAVEIPDLLPRP